MYAGACILYFIIIIIYCTFYTPIKIVCMLCQHNQTHSMEFDKNKWKKWDFFFQKHLSVCGWLVGRATYKKKWNELKSKQEKNTTLRSVQQSTACEGICNVCAVCRTSKCVWNCQFMNCGNNHKHCQYKIVFLLSSFSVKREREKAEDKKWWKSFGSISMRSPHAKDKPFSNRWLSA